MNQKGTPKPRPIKGLQNHVSSVPPSRQSAWSAFETFCHHQNLDACPASPAAVARFIDELSAGGRRLSDVRAAIRAIASRHLEGGHSNPVESPEALDALSRAAGVVRLSEALPDAPGVSGSSVAALGAAAAPAPPRRHEPSQAIVPVAPRDALPAEILPAGIESSSDLPRVLAGHDTPGVRRQVEGFYGSVAAMFEAWLRRRENPNTQRAYRADVMAFVAFLGIRWPEYDARGHLLPDAADESSRLLQVTVPEVQAFRDHLRDEKHAAPKTINRQVSSVSGFYKFMREAASEARLPINVPNPAHAQFIARESQDPVDPTEALTPARARKLVAMPSGDSVIEARDRAILKFYLYTGARIGTGCRIHVSDFLLDDEDAKLKIQEKGRGRSKRTIGIHFTLAESLQEYIQKAELTSGPLFRARKSPKGDKLSDRAMDESSMYRLIQGYLEALPGAMKEVELPDGKKERRCIFSPHSLRATTATLLLDASEDITAVQALLGHKHVTTTQIYDKRRRSTKESASHHVPI